jgi:polyphosphate glucokinase
MEEKQTNKVLTIDIGGSHIKATILNQDGEMVVEYQKLATPANATPITVLETIATLTKGFPEFDKISVGFPGYVKNGIIITAPNLNNKAFKNQDLGKAIAQHFKKPVRLVNDADLQGLGVIEGEGLEMVMTLGTGFGTALFMAGKLLPHLELAHLPVRKGKDYDAFIGDAALQKDGLDKWNLKVKEVLKTFKNVINYDTLYLSGGNTKKINFKLDGNVKKIGNRDGIKGGVDLWKEEDGYCIQTVQPK